MTDTLKRLSAADVTSLVVAAVDSVADGVLRLDLASADGGELPSWEPGAHVDLILENGMMRQYSLCGDPANTATWTLGILHEPQGRGGSRWLCTALARGDRIDAQGPRNHFALVEAGTYLLIAGGIGITPMLPMMRELEARGADWSLLYLGRRRDAMAFVDELDRYGDRVTVWPTSAKGERVELVSLIDRVASDAAVYCCGPGALMDAVEQACQARLDVHLYAERFQPRAVEPVSDHTFEVVAEQSGITVSVGPDTSIADALETAGVLVSRSCGEGTCGSCETDVLEGVPDHRDSVLTAHERERNKQMMVCCSRAYGERIVLDI